VGCKDVRDATLVMLNRIGTLERLVLDHCNRLEVAHFTLPHLHTLSLRSCRRLKELSVDTASLTSIDPNECQALTTVKLHAACLPTLQLDHLLALHTVRNPQVLPPGFKTSPHRRSLRFNSSLPLVHPTPPYRALGARRHS